MKISAVLHASLMPLFQLQGASSYCPERAHYVEADPEDLQIVCRVYNVGPVPESETLFEREIVLDVTKIANHPEYQPGRGMEVFSGRCIQCCS